MYQYGDRFLNVQAFLNVIRHEEVEQLTHQILALRSQDRDYWPMYAKHEDRELTQREVWDKAIELAAEILDERLGRLGSE